MQKYRSYLVRRIKRYYFISYQGTEQNPPYSVSDTSFLEGVNARTAGGSVPGYRRRIAKAIDATTAMSGTRYSFELGTGRARQAWFDKTTQPVLYTVYERSGDLINPTMPVDPIGRSVTSAENSAKAKFLQKASSVQTQILGGVVLGELGETLHMLRNPAKSLRAGLSSYLSSLKEKRARYTRRLPKRDADRVKKRIISDTWLEYTYGWRPFLNDIKDASKALQRDEIARASIPIKAVGVDESGDNILFGQGSIGALKWNVYRKRTSRAIIIYRGAVVRNTGTPRENLSKIYGFNMDSFVPTVWELIPYSFLVDYFTNIGDVLQAMSYNTSQISWANRTQVLLGIDEWQATEPQYFALAPQQVNIEQSFSPSKARCSIMRFNRDSYGGSFIPSLEFKIPGLSSTRWLNLAALGAQHRRLTPF